MAANLAQLNNYLNNMLLIVDAPIRDALNKQGLLSFDDFVDLTKTDIEEICTNIRKPGGQIVNPNAGIANQPPMITNPGIPIGHVFEKRLKLLHYYVFHLTRIQHMPVIPGGATLANLNRIYHLKELDEPSDDVDLPSPLVKIDHARVALENLDDYLICKRGESSGLPLSYVVCEAVALPVPDPGLGQPTYLDEMVARGSHVGVYYQVDNVAV